MMNDWALYILAALGAAFIARLVLWPLLWIGLYATGALIFDIRCARADERRPKIKLSHVWASWTRHLRDGLCWPASEITCGQLSWKPLFQFRGFKREERS